MKLWDILIEGGAPAQDIITNIQEPEAQTLSQLYDPWDTPRVSSLGEYIYRDDLVVRELLKTRSSTSSGNAGTSALHEEQERQITHEVQREQQVCRPPMSSPLTHHLHEDILHFVEYGSFPGHSSSAVTLAFETLRQTSAGQFNFPQCLGSQLYASDDFIKTVQRVEGTVDDQFLKPVHCALSNVHNSDLLLLSQYEANELLPEVRVSLKDQAACLLREEYQSYAIFR